jgi:hypothetical protein
LRKDTTNFFYLKYNPILEKDLYFRTEITHLKVVHAGAEAEAEKIHRRLCSWLLFPA